MIAYHTAGRSEFRCDSLLDAVLLTKALANQGLHPVRFNTLVVLNETQLCHSWTESLSLQSLPQ
jgi:hypothetical protein